MIALPTSASAGFAHACVFDGTTTNYHFLSLTTDGGVLTLPCVDAPVGTPASEGIPADAPASPRVIVSIAANGTMRMTALSWSPFSTAFVATQGVSSATSLAGHDLFIAGYERYYASTVRYLSNTLGGAAGDGSDYVVTDVNMGIIFNRLCE